MERAQLEEGEHKTFHCCITFLRITRLRNVVAASNLQLRYITLYLYILAETKIFKHFRFAFYYHSRFSRHYLLVQLSQDKAKCFMCTCKLQPTFGMSQHFPCFETKEVERKGTKRMQQNSQSNVSRSMCKASKQEKDD